MAEVFRCCPPEQTAEAVDWIRKQTPVCLGAGKISFPSGSHQPITLEFDEADLLESLIDQGGTAKTAELQRVADNPSRIFAQMLEGNPALKPHFRMPGRRGRGHNDPFKYTVQYRLAEEASE